MVVIIKGDAASEELSTVHGTVRAQQIPFLPVSKHSIYLQGPYTMTLTTIAGRKAFHPKLQRDLSVMDVKKLLFLKCQLPYDKNHFRIYEEEIGK